MSRSFRASLLCNVGALRQADAAGSRVDFEGRLPVDASCIDVAVCQNYRVTEAVDGGPNLRMDAASQSVKNDESAEAATMLSLHASAMQFSFLLL